MGLVFSAFILLLMLALDLFVLHRHAEEISFRETALFSAFWIALALLLGVFVWACSGRSCSAPSSSVTM
jgi:tellurite resistance protein TerC